MIGYERHRRLLRFLALFSRDDSTLPLGRFCVNAPRQLFHTRPPTCPTSANTSVRQNYGGGMRFLSAHPHTCAQTYLCNVYCRKRVPPNNNHSSRER